MTDRCPECGGSGNIPCTNCDGGSANCSGCDGEGEFECETCDGTGEVDVEPDEYDHDEEEARKG